MSAPSSWVPSDFSDVVARYQDNCRLVRTFLIELTQTLEWLTWLLGLSSLDSGPAIGSRPMTAIGAKRKPGREIGSFRSAPKADISEAGFGDQIRAHLSVTESYVSGRIENSSFWIFAGTVGASST